VGLWPLISSYKIEFLAARLRDNPVLFYFYDFYSPPDA
jgi:hypothetical protein